jgi:Flp pilus assembly protein TadD
MRRRVLPIVLSLSLAFTLPAFAQDDEQHDPLDTDVAAKLDRALGALTPGDPAISIVAAAVRAQGDDDPLLRALAEVYGDEEADESRRDAARWIAAETLHRRGDLRDALVHVERLHAKQAGFDVALRRAELLDATGRREQATQAYEEILAGGATDELATRLRLRMALLAEEQKRGGAGSSGVTRFPGGMIIINSAGRSGGTSKKRLRPPTEAAEQLVAFASGETMSAELRNRAAILLGTLGYPKQASELFVAPAGEEPDFRDVIRSAEWALGAEDWETARERAWAALDVAGLRRDRLFALAVLVESYRADEKLDDLVSRIEAIEQPDDALRNLWIDLLRETGRVDDALELFRRTHGEGLTVAMRREILEMHRQTGDEERLISAYREQIDADPARVEWREGLSRYFLEQGDRDAALAVWTDGPAEPQTSSYRLATAEALQGLGLDDVAIERAEACVAAQDGHEQALLFLSSLHKSRGRFEEAGAALDRLDDVAAADSPVRMSLAEALEKLGRKDRAAQVLQDVIDARGIERGAEDVEMHLAWLHGELGQDEEALTRWRALWERVEAVSRRRYVEDRMMTVASRLGELADIVVDLETRLAEGEALKRESGLLVRIYTKVGDSVSATEIIDEHMKRAGGDPVKTLVEKSFVYLACTDYMNYEETLDELIEIDPENTPDYLQQLAMSKLERGRHDEARDVLKRLQELEVPDAGLEFEAGVLAIAGLREEALATYRKGLAGRPENIDSFLLLANVMRDLGKTERAIGMFQFLAQHAEKDDLFTIAIDGLLNMEAPPDVLKWARRAVYERLAMKADKVYLHRLAADLAEELGETESMLLAVESALPIAAEQRVPFLRELMDTSSQYGLRGESLRFGRRLLASGELVPPQVYLDLGNALLADGDVLAAEKTFARASDVPDQEGFRLKVADSFEKAGFLREALRAYQQVLVGRVEDAGLMVKTGELFEQLGRDDRAAEIHRRAIDAMLRRRPYSVVEKEKEETNPRNWWMGNRNVDEFDEHYPRALRGWLASVTEEDALVAMQRDAEAVGVDLAKVQGEGGDASERRLDTYQHLRDRAALHRRTALAFRRAGDADALDAEILRAFPGDEKLLDALVRGRLTWGRRASAARLLDESGRSAKDTESLRWLVGGNGGATPGTIPLAEVSRRVLPLWRDGDTEALTEMLVRANITAGGEDALAAIPTLLWAALELKDPDLTLLFGRAWLRLAAEHSQPYEVERQADLVIGRCAALLGPAELRSLAMTLVEIVRKEPDKYVGLVAFLPRLQQRFEEPLLTSEQALELVETMAERRSWGMGELLRIIPPEETLEAIRTGVEKAPESRRAIVLPQLLGGLERPAGEELAAYAVRTFEESLSGVKDEWWLRSLLSNSSVRHEENLELFLQLADILLDKHPEIIATVASRVTYLVALGREEEALEAGLDRYKEYLTRNDGDWQWRSAAQQIEAALLPKHRDAFLKLFDEIEQRDGHSAALSLKRLDFIQRDAEPQEMLAAAEAAAERFPDDTQLRERHIRALRALSRRRAMIDVLEAAARREPKEVALVTRIQAEWTALRHAPNALMAKKRADAIRKQLEEERGAGEDTGERIPPANVNTLKQAIEDEDEALARTTFRRMWRLFNMDPRFAAMWGANNLENLWWPWTRPETEGPPPRGGLEGFLARGETTPYERRSVYQELAPREFALDEMRRLARVTDPVQLRQIRSLHTGLATALTERDDVADVIAATAASVSDGSGDARDEALLLALLEQHPEAVDASLRATLDALTAATQPSDGKAILQLARVHARAGDADRAAQLYRWCAYLSSAAGVWGTGNLTSLDARQLVDTALDDLEGETLADFVDTLAVCADPGEYHWGRDGFETLMLETWAKAQGPAEALRRGAKIVENVTDTTHAMKRNTAKVAAALLARADRSDDALRCLEFAVAKSEPTAEMLLLPVWERQRLTMGGHLSYPDVQRLFSPVDDDWTPPPAWLAAAGDAISSWVRAERIDRRQAFVAVALLSLRLHEAGDTARSADLRALVDEMAEDFSGRRLWAADLARMTGDTDTADSLEEELLVAGALFTERIAEVLRRIAARDGPADALRVAGLVHQWTAHPDFLAAMVEIAEWDPEAHVKWSDRAEEERAAREALEAEDE